MGPRKEKGTSGEAKRYISRNDACKKLQLRLSDFRKLCILKGIYPREPKSRKKAQKGDTSIRSLFLRKDMDFLAAEPIIWTLRKQKTYHKKLQALKQEREVEQLRRHRRNKPTYTIDHLVLERYPTFRAALQEMDDALSSIFLYAALPVSKNVSQELTQLCKRLSIEFMLFCIQSRHLRKVFVTIKGYYYRAIIQGEEITWVVPHPFRPETPTYVDMTIMSTFIKFYTTFMGFINFKLYQSINLHYPPKLTDGKATLPRRSKKNKMKLIEMQCQNLNLINSLNTLIKVNKGTEDDQEVDNYDITLMSHDEDYKKGVFLSQTKEVEANLQRKLFEGKKFYLGRETNRESLTFVIRCAGGLVSWDESADYGSTYQEDDPDISFQISDRPLIEKKYLSRYYLQPQWVYDSFNAGIHMPVQQYFVGVDLPAHVSPFEEENNFYQKISPESLQLKALKNKLKLLGSEGKGDEASDSDEDESSDEGIGIEEEEDSQRENKTPWKELTEEEQSAHKTASRLNRIKITKCKTYNRFKEANEKRQEKQDFKLAASFVHRKQKKLFKRVLVKEKKQRVRMDDLKRKRILYEKEMKRQRKEAAKRKAADNAMGDVPQQTVET